MITPIPQEAFNIAPAYAEVTMIVGASLLLLVDMYLSESKRSITYLLSLALLAVCATISYGDFMAGTTTYTFNGMYVSDPMSNLLKLLRTWHWV